MRSSQSLLEHLNADRPRPRDDLNVVVAIDVVLQRVLWVAKRPVLGIADVFPLDDHIGTEGPALFDLCAWCSGGGFAADGVHVRGYGRYTELHYTM